VDWVSQRKPFLGFDILSFGNEGSEEYIEVKSSVGKMKSFYFTANEMNVASEIGDAYRLVCVSTVTTQPNLMEFRNPVKAISDGILEVKSDTSLVSICS